MGGWGEGGRVGFTHIEEAELLVTQKANDCENLPRKGKRYSQRYEAENKMICVFQQHSCHVYFAPERARDSGFVAWG